MVMCCRRLHDVGQEIPDSGFRIGFAGRNDAHAAHRQSLLEEIRDELEEIIKKYQPTRMAVEELFFFNNAKTAMDVGQARGVVLLLGIQHGLPIDEFTPLQVKQGLTGYGRAEKDQMQKVVAMVLGLKGKIKSDDAADALAVAITAGQSLWLEKLGKV